MKYTQIVSDSTPLMHLEAQPDGFSFLRRVFEKIYIPEAVAEELAEGYGVTPQEYLQMYGLTDFILSNCSMKTIEIQSHIITVEDGTPLASTLYLPHSTPQKVVILNSAMGVKRTFYDPFARFLAEEGMAAVTYDYRGIGESRPARLKQFQATARDWGQKDFSSVIEWVTRHIKTSTIHVVGHSIGGQVLGLASNSDCLASIVTVAAQSGYWKWYRPQLRYAFLWFALLPTLTRLYGYFPSRKLGMGEDIPAGVALEWAAWCRDPNYLFGKRHGLDIHRYQKLDRPMLAFSFEDDHYAPKRAVDELLQHFSGAKIDRRHLVPLRDTPLPIGHFGFFKQDFRASLWRETVDWLRAT